MFRVSETWFKASRLTSSEIPAVRRAEQETAKGYRSYSFYTRVPFQTFRMARRLDGGQTGHLDSMAPQGIPTVLEMEVSVERPAPGPRSVQKIRLPDSIQPL